jgi:translocation and assembly module TamB
MKRFFHISAKILKVLFLTILLLLVALAIFLNSSIFDSIIKKQIQTRLGKAINRKVTVDSVAFNPFNLDIYLRNFTIGNDPRSPDLPFFKAKEIYADVSWQNLFAGRVRVSKVRLVDPELNILFYKEGGNNWPKTKPKAKTNKKSGINFAVSQVDCDNMTVTYNRLKNPTIDFSVYDLEAFVEYDETQRNYVATTHFRDGKLKIADYEFFQFDLEARYRIAGGHVLFERLFFLGPRTKFYMAGDMSNFKDPFFDFRFRSRINLDQARQMFHFGPEMSGSGNFRATFKGTFGKFHMVGLGDFRDFMFYLMPIDHATFNLDMTDNSLDVTKIHASMFGGSYDGNFSIGPLKGHSIFKTDAKFRNWDGRRLTRFIKMENMVLPIKGSGEAKLRWDEGHLKDMVGDFHFAMEPTQGTQADLAAEAERTDFDNSLYLRPYVLPVRNDTRFRIEKRQLREIDSHLETPYTTADFRGTIDFSGAADLQVQSRSAKIPEIDLLFHHLQSYFTHKPIQRQEFWEVRGAADFDGRLTETVWSPFEPRLNGHVIAHNVLYHGVPWSAVDADVEMYKKLIDVTHADLAYGRSTGQAKARFFLEDKKKGLPDAIEATASVTNYPIHEIPHAFTLELPVNGTVNATLDLKGPFHSLEGRSDFEAFSGDMWGQHWDHASGSVLFFPDSLGLRNIRAEVKNGGYAEASGDLVYDSDEFTVQFEGDRIPLESLNLLKDNGMELTGLASAEGSGHGTFRKPQMEGKIRVANLTYRDQLYGDVSSYVKLEQDRLTLQASGMAQGVSSNINADIRLDGKIPVNAEFDIQKFPIEILTRAYASKSIPVTGNVGGKFQLAGTLNPPNIQRISGALDTIQMNAFGLALKSARPLNVTLNERVIQIKDSLLIGPSTELSLTGNIYPEDRGRLDLNLTANVGLDVLSRWQKDITASGEATAKISINGNFRQPSLAGVMQINNGFFRHFSFPNSLTDISALVTFKNQDISLQSFHANSSGGKLTAGGSAKLKGYSLDTYRFDVYADKIRVQYPEGLRSTVNAELHLQAQQDASFLTGDVNVLQGVYVRSFEESPSVFGYARVPAFAGLTAAAGATSPNAEMKLNIHIHSDGNLLVRNNFANINSSADLNLTGTLDDPVLVGRIEVQKGVITFQNREYQVVRGALDFSNPYRTDPLLNFVAETKVREYRITLTFSGTFDRIYHDITSDPPLPRDDLYALLGVGYAPGDLAPGQDVSTLLAGQEISRFIASPIASPLEKGFRKVFGLQRFQIDPTYVQSTQVATARITLQKNISSDFSITYSTNLFTAAEEIVLLQYQLTDEVQITASKDERARYGIDVLVTKTFE